HRRDVTLRRTRYDLRKAEARAHILEGFVIALDNIDRIIEIIRASATVDDARAGLMSEFGLSEIQATEILNMRLRRLTGLERAEIEAELAEVRATIEYLKSILDSDEKLLDVIEEELIAVRDQYGNPRRTTIVQDDAELNIEDLIPVEDMVVTVSHEGYIKRVPLAEYRTQHRGGRGKSGMSTKDTDFVEHVFVASTHAHMLFFTTEGRVFSERVFSLPAGSRTARGKPIVNVLPLEGDEKLAMVRALEDFTEGNFLFFATAKGQVKKTDLMAYSRIRSTGIKAIKLNDDDQLIAVRQTTGASHVILSTANGMSIRFDENDVRPMGRDSMGVRGIKLRDGDHVVGCVTFEPDDIDQTQTWLLSATEHGYGKRTTLENYYRRSEAEDGTVSFSVQGRGGYGLNDIHTGKRNGPVVGVALIEAEGDEYLIVTNGGVIIRARAAQVREVNRNTKGVRLINLGDDERVVSLARNPESEDEDESEATEDPRVVVAEADQELDDEGLTDDPELDEPELDDEPEDDLDDDDQGDDGDD
ncbi:MAG: DNA gyrase subunit A, partial [Myxococcales bacterium]|nr:DNA gyrase subunit A [Myxococcales bacterium]